MALNTRVVPDTPSNDVVRIGDLELDGASFEATHAGRRVRLRGKPFVLLSRLARDPGCVVLKAQLMTDLWPNQAIGEWALTSAVREARRALNALGAGETVRVEAVRGRGYRLSLPAIAGVPAPGEPLPDGTRHSPGTLVGRDDEQRRLAAALDEMLAGTPRTVLVAGPAGIGKSRLASHFASSLPARGIDVLWGRCHEGEGPPLWPWAEMVRSYIRSRPAEQVRAILHPVAPDLARVLPSVRALFDDLTPPPPEDPEVARLGLFDSFVELFDRIADVRPCVLVLDDVHWADPSSLMLLRTLATRHASGRLMLLALYRDDEIEAPHPGAELVSVLAREERVVMLPLRPLSAEDSALLLEQLGARPDDDPRLEEVARIAGGNPYFLAELYRNLGESAHDQLPEQVERVVLRRIARRTPAARETIACAAVIGEEFGADLLRHVVDAGVGPLEDALDELVRARLIDAPAAAGDPHRFAHALTRHAVYADIPPSQRVRLHLAVAEHLEALLGGAAPGELAGVLAEHFDRASEIAGSDRAFTYHRLAGEEALRRLSFEQASHHLSRAAALFDAANPPAADAASRDAGRCELLIALSEAARMAGDGVAADHAWDEALRLAREIDAPELLAHCVCLAPFVTWEDAHLTAIHEEALDRLGPCPTVLRARVMASLAQRLADIPGMRQRREKLLDEALRITDDAGDAAARVFVLDVFSITVNQADAVAERLRRATELSDLAAATGNAWARALGHARRHAALLQQGNLGDAVVEVEALRTLAAQRRWPRLRWFADAVGFVEAFVGGRLVEAEERCLRAADLAREAHQPLGALIFGTQFPHLLREQGRLEEFGGLLDGFAAAQPVWAWGTEIARGYLGDRDALRRLLASVVTERGGPLRHDSHATRLLGLCWLAEACIQLGESEHAAFLHAELVPMADTWAIGGNGIYTAGSIHRALGHPELLRGRVNPAIRQYEAALETNAHPRAALLRLWTTFALARALRRRGKKGDVERADRLIGETHAEACALGLVGLRRRIETEGDG